MVTLTDPNLYESPNHPGLILPRYLNIDDPSTALTEPKTYQVNFKKTEINIAIEGYTTPPQEMINTMRNTQKFIGNPAASRAVLLGTLQNPTMEDKTGFIGRKDAYRLHLEMTNLELFTLLRTNIPWITPFLQHIINSYNQHLQYISNSNQNKHITSWAQALGQYTGWNKNNVHLLTTINHPAALQTLAHNINIPEEIRMIGALTTV